MRPPIDILPIQIRPDLIVQIAGIPHDLTREEAEKIARVVMAMARTPDGGSGALTFPLSS
jgi:hypothetical protein